MMHYIEWDFDRMIATEYERQGECNGCGECCTGEQHFNFQNKGGTVKVTDIRQELGGTHWVNGKGIWQEVRDGDTRLFRQFVAYVPTGKPCASLQDNKCALQVLLRKPALCQLWPAAPREIAPFSDCSYSFVRVTEWPIELGTK